MTYLLAVMHVVMFILTAASFELAGEHISDRNKFRAFGALCFAITCWISYSLAGV